MTTMVNCSSPETWRDERYYREMIIVRNMAVRILKYKFKFIYTFT